MYIHTHLSVHVLHHRHEVHHVNDLDVPNVCIVGLDVLKSAYVQHHFYHLYNLLSMFTIPMHVRVAVHRYCTLYIERLHGHFQRIWNPHYSKIASSTANALTHRIHVCYIW